MSVEVAELEKNVGNRVVLHIVQEDGSLEEVEGKLEAASVAGVAFKAKGKSSIDLLTVEQIEELQTAPEKPKPVSQKKLKPIELGQARQHLVDRHGVELKWARDADEAKAFEYHEGLDHSNLGHTHVASEPTARDEALADEAPASDEDAA
jgi:hypothetical protein